MLLIKNGYVKSMAGADIENGAVLIENADKIAAIGKTIEAPEGATVYVTVADGKVVYRAQ